MYKNTSLCDYQKRQLLYSKTRRELTDIIPWILLDNVTLGAALNLFLRWTQLMCMKSVEVWFLTFFTSLVWRVFEFTGLAPHPWLKDVLCLSDRHPAGAQSQSKRGGGAKRFTTPRHSNSKYSDVTQVCVYVCVYVCFNFYRILYCSL